MRLIARCILHFVALQTPFPSSIRKRCTSKSLPSRRVNVMDWYSSVLMEVNSKEKLYQWILRHQEGGSRLNTIDILGYLQTELDYHGEEPSMSPRAPLHNQNPQPTMNIANPSSLVSSGSSGDQQPKSCVFSNALSSPVRRSLQNYHISRGGGNSYNNNPPQPQSVVAPNGFRNTESNFLQEQTRDPNPCNSNDSFMDMHADSPSHDSTY